MKNDFCILSISLSPWDYPFWTSRQCLMYELSTHCNVFYTTDRNHWRSQLRPSFWKDKLTKDQQPPFPPPKNVTIIKPGITHPLFYGKKTIDTFFLNKFSQKIKQIIRKIKPHTSIYLYIWHPDCVDYIKAINPEKVIYHPHDRFTEYGIDSTLKEKLYRNEQKVLAAADAVITPHKKIAEILGHPNSHIVSSAVFTPAFLQETPYEENELHQRISKIPRPRIGYLGGINEKINFRLIADISLKRQDWSIILMGPQRGDIKWRHDHSFLTLLERKNVHLLGPVRFNEVASYIRFFDIGCIPYTMKGHAAFIESPLKMYQYWALGKPIISSNLPNLKDDPGVLSVGVDSQDWIEKIEWELAHDCSAFKDRRYKEVDPILRPPGVVL
jgi:hypothetical protein